MADNITNTSNLIVNTAPYLSQSDIFIISILCIFLFIGIIGYLIYKLGTSYLTFENPKNRPNLLTYVVVILVILTIILLGLNKNITSESLTTLLGAIVGYVLGRAAPKGFTSETETPEEKTKICNACKIEYTTDNKFCSQCGEELEEIQK